MICRKVKMLAAATVAVVMLAAGAWAQESWTSGSTTVTLNNGTLTVSGTGAMANYTSGTNMPWNSVKSSITGVVIEEGVTNIGNYAFYGCTGLTSVTIPNSVTSIGSRAFYQCAGLTSATIPNNVTAIEGYAFYGCTGLTSVTIGSDVTSIGNYAFQNCAGLTSVTIPDGVTSISTGAFAGCSRLTSIETGDGNSAYSSVDGVLFNKDKSTLVAYPGGKQGPYSIPNSVTAIEDYAFYQCTGLTSVMIPNGVTSIGTSVFFGCTGLTSVTIPSGVTSIGNNAFQNCTGLTSVTIPSGVTSIGNNAFFSCSGLTLVTSLAVVPPTITASTFANVNAALLYVPEGSAGAYRAADQWKRFGFIDGSSVLWECGASPNTAAVTATLDTTDWTLTISGTGAMGNYVTNNVPWVGLRSSITGVTIEEGVTNIGDYAFYACSSMTSVTIPSSVTSIGTSAFAGCSSLTSIETGDGNSAYSSVVGVLFNKDKSTLVAYPGGKQGPYSIPNSVTAIGGYAFSGCTGLTSVTIPNDVTSIGERAFYGCAGLTSVTIPNSVTSIGNYAFYGCAGLTSMTSLAEVPPTLGTGAFQNVSALLYVPEGSAAAYMAADQWKSLGIIDGSSRRWDCGASPNEAAVTATLNTADVTLTISGTGAMANYTNTTVPWASYRNFITTVAVEEGVTNIGNFAFYACSGMTSVTIGNDVTSIGNNAFYNCTGLTSVTLPSSVTSIGNSAFYQCTGLTSVTIPSGVTSIGTNVFNGCTGLTSVTSLIDIPLTINSNVFTNVLVASATLYVPEASVEAYSAADVWQSFGTIEANPTTSIATGDRVIPQTKPKEEATVIAPVTVLSGEFTAGPNPVGKLSGSVNFYRQGKRVANSELRIYDATGNVINKVKISDKAIGSQAKRQVGEWDLTDKKGRPVSEGTYLVKGVIKTSDGKSEKVSVILGVR